MNRREFLKRLTGFTLGAAGVNLALPKRVKAQLLGPVTDLVGAGYLDSRIALGLQKLRRERPGWRFGETHCHTRYSDGNHTVGSLLRRAEALGLDFIVITEHLTPRLHPMEPLMASIRARSRFQPSVASGTRPPLAAYPGFEISTREGHLILVFPETYLGGQALRDMEKRFLPFERSMPSMETAALWGRELGAVSIIPHPNIERSYPFGVSTRFVRKHLLGAVDAIEDISTGHGYRANHSRRLGLASIGSSDDHFNFLIGSTVTGYDGTRYPDLPTAVQARATRAFEVDHSLHSLIAAARTLF